MEEPQEDVSVSRAAIVRTSQACQRCRTLKTRCLPSAQANICRRCLGASKECIWADVARRVKKLRAPSRIAQVEEKIDSIVAKLVNATGSMPQAGQADIDSQATTRELSEPASNSGVAPGSWMAVPSFEPEQTESNDHTENEPEDTDPDRHYLSRLRSVHSFGDSEDIAQAPASLFQPSNRPEAPIDNDMVQGLLASGEADVLLDGYRKMSTSFPFVIIPPCVTGQDLHRSRPMLLLAVLTVASWIDHQRQMALDEIFRNELATRTIIRPRRTLGLVQSVLVYLSWYHFVFSHKTQQIFFLQHLVIGLAIDIGLHQEFRPMGFPQAPKPPPPPPAERRERHRAFLGCYYLASMIAAGLQKPNLLKHTGHMKEWAEQLKCDREYESDTTIDHLISLRQIDDQIHDTLFQGEAHDLSLVDARTSMHMRFMEAQLDNWKRDSVNVASQRLLILSHSFTDLWLHSVALRIPPTPHQLSADSAHLSALLAALESGKRFLDALLSFPTHEYYTISFSEWMRLPTVIMTVARLCIPTEEHVAVGWDVKAAQERVRLDLCLESLCYRMQTLSTYDKQKQKHPDFWYAMRFINDLTKTWYMRKIRPAPSASNLSTPSDMLNSNQSTTEVLRPSNHSTPGHSMQQPGLPYGRAGINFMPDINMDLGAGNNDFGGPFDFMKDMEFDMGQFLDSGIWGDDAYSSMGFGGGMPF